MKMLWKKLKFPNYELLDDIDKVYENLIQRSWQLPGFWKLD